MHCNNNKKHLQDVLHSPPCSSARRRKPAEAKISLPGSHAYTRPNPISTRPLSLSPVRSTPRAAAVMPQPGMVALPRRRPGASCRRPWPRRVSSRRRSSSTPRHPRSSTRRRPRPRRRCGARRPRPTWPPTARCRRRPSRPRTTGLLRWRRRPPLGPTRSGRSGSGTCSSGWTRTTSTIASRPPARYVPLDSCAPAMESARAIVSIRSSRWRFL
jgi:hypothetical protein